MSSDPGTTSPLRSRWAIAAVTLGAIALVIGLFLVFGGSEEKPRSGGPRASASPSASPKQTGMPKRPGPRVPEFRFHLASVKGFASAAGVKHEPKARRAIRKATRSIDAALDRLYTQAFLDPRNWTRGSYGSVFKLFVGSAHTPARKSWKKLTLGPDAGRKYRAVRNPEGTLDVRVLLDRGAHAFTAAVDTRFKTRAVRKNGHLWVIESVGTYFLRPTHGVWRIYGYDVKRHDHPPKPAEKKMKKKHRKKRSPGTG